MEDKWMYSFNEEGVWYGEEFDTKEEVIAEGRKEALLEKHSEFLVGQIEKVFPSGVDVDFIIENVAENTTNDIYEVGDEYLCDVTKEHSDELEEKLNEVLFDWMKKHSYEPSFFSIKNVETIKL